MPAFISAMFGPQLYRLHQYRRSYDPNVLESSGDKMISLGSCVLSFCAAVSPILVPYVLLTWPQSNYGFALKAAATFYAVAYSLRTCGRLISPEYVQFIELLSNAKSQPANAQLQASLRGYDFEVFAAPAHFIAKPVDAGKWFEMPIQGRELGQPLNWIREIVAWISANTFGRRILYPGSLAVFHSMVNGQLIDGRRKLVEERGAERNIVLTEDGNKLDTIFVDNRANGGNGDTLVISCEGNAGFLEMGVMKTPTDLHYSVLGWNMPGFGESTGVPRPRSILLSMEAIMQFAIEKLGFPPGRIVLFAWSIGGFPATWAAANYPGIRALILDASFDDVVHLAIARFPSAVEGLVRFAVQKHLNLPISRQLHRYQGPVLIIRRWNDEIIATEDGSEEVKRASNRANWLLLDLLRHRYPGLVRSAEDEECVFDWLDRDPQERLTHFPPEDSMEPVLPDTADLASLGRDGRDRLIHQLCSKYFVDFLGATHNSPLRPEYFNIPDRIGQ